MPYINGRVQTCIHSEMCLEKLILTLLVWICGFNLVEKAVGCWESKIDQVMIYVGILIAIIIYISVVDVTKVCNLT